MINLSPVSFLKNIKLNSTNPINFKGGLKEDVFEKQQNDTNVEQLIAQAKERISKTEALIEKKNLELEQAKQEFNAKLQKIRDYIKNTYGEKSKEYKSFDGSIDDYYSIYSLNKSHKIGGFGVLCADDVLHEMRKITDEEYAVERFCKHLEKLKSYEAHLETHPKTAFLYDPDIDDYKKIAMLKALPNIEIKKSKELAQELGIPTNIIKSHIRQGIFIVDIVDGRSIAGLDRSSYTYIIDTDYKANETYFRRIKELTDSVIESGEFYSRYNFSENTVAKYIKEGKLVTFFGEGDNTAVFYIDPNDEINAQTIKEHLKTTPLKSEKYYKSSAQDYKTLLVPASYLSKLGFGSIKEIHEGINNGTIKGNAQRQPDGKIKVTVDIASNETEQALKAMRSKNRSIATVEQLAKRLNIKPEEIENALIDDEMEIIPEFIFDLDYKETYIDLRKEKNAKWLDKILFEKQIEASIKKSKNRSNSIRMKLVWALCPYTRKVASEELHREMWVKSILDKKTEEGEEALSLKEQIQIKAYFKNMWLQAGVEEYNNALIKAKEILIQYKQGGIDAIEDPEIREILTDILSFEFK